MTEPGCERSRAVGLVVAHAVLAGLLLAGLATACTSDDDSAATTIAPVARVVTPTTITTPTTDAPTTTAAPTPSVAPTPAATAAPTTPAPPTTLPDGATVLQQSFDELAGGYHFVTTATVNGTPALTVEGDFIGGSTRMTVTSQGKSVDYIVLPDQTWVAENGSWQELEEPAPAGDPIGSLRTPDAVTVMNYAPEQTTLTANYPPSALNLTGDQPVTVVFELSGTTLRAIAYQVPNATSSVRADITSLVDTTPITSPSAGE